MKIQIDTTNKVIKIEESVNLGDLIELLDKLLPEGEWKEFKLETQTVNNWTNPIIIEPYKPSYPNLWQTPPVTFQLEYINT